MYIYTVFGVAVRKSGKMLVSFLTSVRKDGRKESITVVSGKSATFGSIFHIGLKFTQMRKWRHEKTPIFIPTHYWVMKRLKMENQSLLIDLWPPMTCILSSVLKDMNSSVCSHFFHIHPDNNWSIQSKYASKRFLQLWYIHSMLTFLYLPNIAPVGLNTVQVL